MKRTIQLRESDIHRMVMEAVRRMNESDKAMYISQDYGDFDQDAFDAEGDDKRAQENAAWDLYNSNKYKTRSFYPDENENVEDNGRRGRYSLASQGYDTIHDCEATLPQIMFGQEHMGNITDAVKAGYANWAGGGIPGEEYFDDGPVPVVGMEGYNTGKVGNRNHYNGRYSGATDALEESINRAVKRTIRRMNEGRKLSDGTDADEDYKSYATWVVPSDKLDTVERDCELNTDEFDDEGFDPTPNDKKIQQEKSWELYQDPTMIQNDSVYPGFVMDDQSLFESVKRAIRRNMR